MRKLVQSSASPATNRQYKQQLDTFIDFHKIIHETYKLPASPNTVSMFAAQLHERGLKCATIQTYMSAISNAHKLQNISDPTITYLVTKTLQGIKKNEPVITTNRLPITKTILQLEETVDYLENQSRRNNVRIDGVNERPGETWMETEEAPCWLMERDLKLPPEQVRAMHIEGAHRTGGAPTAGRDRTLIAKFAYFKDKEAIQQAARAMKPQGLGFMQIMSSLGCRSGNQATKNTYRPI